MYICIYIYVCIMCIYVYYMYICMCMCMCVCVCVCVGQRNHRNKDQKYSKKCCILFAEPQEHQKVAWCTRNQPEGVQRIGCNGSDYDSLSIHLTVGISCSPAASTLGAHLPLGPEMLGGHPMGFRTVEKRESRGLGVQFLHPRKYIKFCSLLFVKWRLYIQI